MTPRAAMLALHGCQLYQMQGTIGIAKGVHEHAQVLVYSTTNGFWHRSHMYFLDRYTPAPWELAEVNGRLGRISEGDLKWICEL